MIIQLILKLHLSVNGCVFYGRVELLGYIFLLHHGIVILIAIVCSLVQKEKKDTLYLVRLLRYPLSKKTR